MKSMIAEFLAIMLVMMCFKAAIVEAESMDKDQSLNAQHDAHRLCRLPDPETFVGNVPSILDVRFKYV